MSKHNFPRERQGQINTVTKWLLTATGEVGEKYFQLPVAGKDDAIYRERVYCYELYHQWRSLWIADCPHYLDGEVDKTDHPIIQGNAKPDYIVHIPDDMKNNLLVVEVKPANANEGRMVDDLKKLAQFRSKPASYHAAYFLIYGLATTNWGTLKERLLNEMTKDEISAVRSGVICLIHERAGVRAQIVSWE